MASKRFQLDGKVDRRKHASYSHVSAGAIMGRDCLRIPTVMQSWPGTLRYSIHIMATVTDRYEINFWLATSRVIWFGHGPT